MPPKPFTFHFLLLLYVLLNNKIELDGYVRLCKDGHVRVSNVPYEHPHQILLWTQNSVLAAIKHRYIQEMDLTLTLGFFLYPHCTSHLSLSQKLNLHNLYFQCCITGVYCEWFHKACSPCK